MNRCNVHRHVVCQHRIEVEVWPAIAEVSFRDERFANPLNTNVQFSAAVYNAPTNRVKWQVFDINGAPGAGTIDAAGLYIAPLKGSLPYGFTDIVAATSLDDPFRTAYARVAVVGLGPEPKPAPKIEVYPHRKSLYYPSGDDNGYIDPVNTMQLFRAFRYHTDASAAVEWRVNGGLVLTAPEYLYEVTGAGAPATVTISASLASDPSVNDWATVSLENYIWPGIVS